MTEEKTNIGVRISKDLYDEFRHVAIDLKAKPGELLEEAIRDLLAKKQQPKPKSKKRKGLSI